MDGAKEVATPLNPSVSLKLQDGSAGVDPTPYRRLVGSLQYLAFTRPDISFVVNKLSQFMHSPSEIHWQSLKRVLRYLKGTIHHGLFLKRRSSIYLTTFSYSGEVLNLEVDQRLPIFSTSVPTLFRGDPLVKNLSLVPPPKQNTKLLLMQPLRLPRFKICYPNWVFSPSVRPLYTMIIRALPIPVPTRFITPV